MNFAFLRTATRSFWLAPAIAFCILVCVRFLSPSGAETLEMRWLDRVLRLRTADDRKDDPAKALSDTQQLGWGLAKPLDEQIRFVEINMNERLAVRLAVEGEFGVAAQALRSIASLGPKIIALDILYGYGRQSDQDLLASTIRELNAEGTTKVVVPAEWRAREHKLLYSLPTAGGDELSFGLVNVDVDDDRIWRRYQWTRICDGKTFPSLGMAAFLATLPDGLSATTSDKSPGTLSWKTLDASGEVIDRFVDDRAFLLNFQHSYYDARYDRAAGIGKRVWTLEEIEAVSQDTPVLSPLQDAIVFLGYGADFDAKPLVHGPMEPGMFLHATALHDLLHKTAIYRMSLIQDVLLLLAVGGFAIGCFAWI